MGTPGTNYTAKDWQDGPPGGTPILEADLDHLESQYATIHSERSVPDGFAGLDEEGHVPDDQLRYFVVVMDQATFDSSTPAPNQITFITP